MGALVGTMKKKDLKIYLFFRLSLGVRSSVSLAIGEYYHLSGGGGGGGGGESEDFDRIITHPPPLIRLCTILIIPYGKLISYGPSYIFC